MTRPPAVLMNTAAARTARAPWALVALLGVILATCLVVRAWMGRDRALLDGLVAVGSEIDDPPSRSAALPLRRYPTIEAPDRVAVGETFTVLASLTRELITPETGERPQTMDLPPDEEWELDVVLAVRGFEIIDGNEKRIRMTAGGDSTPARFRLQAVDGFALPHPSSLRVTYWHKGAFILGASRPIVVGEPLRTTQVTDATQGMRPRASRETAPLDLGAPAADLTIYHWGSHVILRSPHLTSPVTELYEPDGALFAWLDQRVARLAQLDRARGVSVEPESQDPARVAVGIGRDLFKRLAPAAFQTSYWQLIDAGVPSPFTIQVFTDDPRIPWELMRPTRSGDSEEHGFLGLRHTVARAHLRPEASTQGRPAATLRLAGLTTIAPRYDPPLVGAQEEQRMLLALTDEIGPVQAVEGSYAAVTQALDAFEDGILHYSGHGEVLEDSTRGTRFGLVLDDGLLEAIAFRGAPSIGDRGHPFVFVNACEVGGSEGAGGYVDGWAPAVLDAGASGFMGALWSVDDLAAVRFSTEFYRLLVSGIDEGVPIAEAVRAARCLYESDPNPSYLAYVFYGDVSMTAGATNARAR